MDLAVTGHIPLDCILSGFTGLFCRDCVLKLLESLWLDCFLYFLNWRHFCSIRWVTTLACGMFTQSLLTNKMIMCRSHCMHIFPSYFRLCPNLFASSLWHWPYMRRLCLFRFHITHRFGRLTVLVIWRKLLINSLFHFWFEQQHMAWLGHWPHTTWFHCWLHMNTVSRLTVLVITHRFLVIRL